ncbi:hypothetical protein ACU635_00330 [[Actinomadura] parvosata]|uniref:hypothetical protein n=1 Tax=[Actinomadura] parvosata TaxID=1955412 RepID=UPI00406C25B7
MRQDVRRVPQTRAMSGAELPGIIPGAIAVVGLSAVTHQEELGRVLRLTLSALAPGGGARAVSEALDGGKGAKDELALWLGLATTPASLTTAMAQFERGRTGSTAWSATGRSTASTPEPWCSR